MRSQSTSKTAEKVEEKVKEQTAIKDLQKSIEAIEKAVL